MEELEIKLKEIKNSIEEIKQVNMLLEKQTNMFDFFDKIDKEVV